METPWRKRREVIITKSSILLPCRELTLMVLYLSPGQEYHVLTPKIAPRGSDTASCPHCQPVRTQDAGKGYRSGQGSEAAVASVPGGTSGQTWAYPETGGGSKVWTRDFSGLLRPPRVSCPHTCCSRCCCLKPPSLTLTWALAVMAAIHIAVTQMEAACVLYMSPEGGSMLSEACLGGPRPEDSDIILS